MEHLFWFDQSTINSKISEICLDLQIQHSLHTLQENLDKEFPFQKHMSIQKKWVLDYILTYKLVCKVF